MVQDAAWEVQVMSLLEDFGLVKIMNGPNSFETAMTRHGFVLPDWMINAIIVGTVAYWAVDQKILTGITLFAATIFAIWFFVVREMTKKTWMS